MNHGPANPVSFPEALRAWVRIALLSFGGPAGQIAVMHRILVEEKRWLSESRFLHALNYCMLLPGPEAQQLATYIGWLLHRTLGGLIAGTLFVLPGFVSILVLSTLYAGFHDTPLVEALFFGLKPAVIAVVIGAVVRLGRRTMRRRSRVGIAVGAFAALFFFQVPFPLVILAAGMLGLAGGRRWPDAFSVAGEGNDSAEEAPANGEDGGAFHGRGARPTVGRSVRVAALWLLLWLGPVLAGLAVLGRSNVYVQEGLFFGTTAVVTFGGAYAVLAFLAQQAVEVYGWLQPGEMLDGLGMAETTPGPLIQVVQFVGFLAAYRAPEPFSPWTAGLIGSVVTTWGHFRAELSVDLPRRPLHRVAARPPNAGHRPFLHHRRRRRGDREPGRMVLPSHAVRVGSGELLVGSPSPRSRSRNVGSDRHCDRGRFVSGHAALPPRNELDVGRECGDRERVLRAVSE